MNTQINKEIMISGIQDAVIYFKEIKPVISDIEHYINTGKL